MSVFDPKTKENNKSLNSNINTATSGGGGTSTFEDNRPETVAQSEMSATANNGPQVARSMQFHQVANGSAPGQMKDDEGMPDFDGLAAGLNYEALAKRINDAISGLGVSQGEVDAALKQVEGNPVAIQGLNNAYLELYGTRLKDDLGGQWALKGESLDYLGNEFQSMESFKRLTGRDTLGRYQWLESDRDNQSGTWETAMTNMTKDQVPDILLPIEQIRDYYIWVTRKLDAKGHESRWVKGALYLVDELSETYDEGITMGNWPLAPKAVIALLEDLNLGIANYAITQFHRLLYGDLSSEPLKGIDAYEFDKQFIETEQGPIAQEIYEKYDGTKALDQMDNVFNGTGFAGNANDALTTVGINSPVPTFPEYFKADLTDSDSDFGSDQRTDIPLFMLYPDLHRSERDYEKTFSVFGFPTGTESVNDLMDKKEIDQTFRYDNKDTDDVYETFKNVNEDIMEKEW